MCSETSCSLTQKSILIRTLAGTALYGVGGAEQRGDKGSQGYNSRKSVKSVISHFFHFDFSSSVAGDLSQNKGRTLCSSASSFSLFLQRITFSSLHCACVMRPLSGKRGVFSVSEEMSQLWQLFMILSLSLKSEPKKQSYDAAVVGFIPSHAWCSLALPLYMNLEALKDSLLLVGVRSCCSTGKLGIGIFLTGA